MAKSVPQRMAIISAGVMMNVIFAFLMAIAAYKIGVEQPSCVVGSVVPGEAAWQADLRPGDIVLEIAGKKMKQFRDLQTAIVLGDIDPAKGVPMLIRRPGVEHPLTVNVKPDDAPGAFWIGVNSSSTTRLIENRKTWLISKTAPVRPGTSAARANPAFCNGDRIVRIDGAPIGDPETDYAKIVAQLASTADREIIVEVNRTTRQGDSAVLMQGLSIPVAPNPMRHVGLSMVHGPITAVQAGSPAEAAGFRPGDKLLAIDGEAIGDPLRLPDALRRRAGQTVAITVERKGEESPVTLSATLREPREFYASDLVLLDSQVGVAALGIAYRLENRVAAVEEGGPAVQAGLQPGDRIVRAILNPPDKETLKKLGVDQDKVEIEFSGSNNRNWPAVSQLLQNSAPGTTLLLTYSRQGSDEKNKLEKEVKLTPIEAADWFNPDRGFVFQPLTFKRTAENFADAVARGGRETLDQMTIAYRGVQKLGAGQVSPRGLAGPWTIIKLALHAADAGTARFLIFLTLLSANLAVINFLPIPVLDGGHFVFLAYEGIRGKPADERVQIALSYIGLALILTLMVWVIGLDFGWIPRR